MYRNPSLVVLWEQKVHKVKVVYVWLVLSTLNISRERVRAWNSNLFSLLLPWVTWASREAFAPFEWARLTIRGAGRYMYPNQYSSKILIWIYQYFVLELGDMADYFINCPFYILFHYFLLFYARHVCVRVQSFFPMQLFFFLTSMI